MDAIRPLLAADLDGVMALWLAGNLQAHSFIPAAYWHGAAPQVRRQLPQAEVYVLTRGGGIAGFIGLLPKDANAAYIAGLFVEADLRGRGLGRRLLNHAKGLYPRLTLQVYTQNRAACRFYRREGFRQTGCGTDPASGQAELTMLWQK